MMEQREVVEELLDMSHDRISRPSHSRRIRVSGIEQWMQDGHYPLVSPSDSKNDGGISHRTKHKRHILDPLSLRLTELIKPGVLKGQKDTNMGIIDTRHQDMLVSVYKRREEERVNGYRNDADIERSEKTTGRFFKKLKSRNIPNQASFSREIEDVKPSRVYLSHFPFSKEIRKDIMITNAKKIYLVPLDLHPITVERRSNENTLRLRNIKHHREVVYQDQKLARSEVKKPDVLPPFSRSQLLEKRRKVLSVHQPHLNPFDESEVGCLIQYDINIPKRGSNEVRNKDSCIEHSVTQVVHSDTINIENNNKKSLKASRKKPPLAFIDMKPTIPPIKSNNSVLLTLIDRINKKAV